MSDMNDLGVCVCACVVDMSDAGVCACVVDMSDVGVCVCVVDMSAPHVLDTLSHTRTQMGACIRIPTLAVYGVPPILSHV